MADQEQQGKSDEILSVEEIESLTQTPEAQQEEPPQPESKYGNKSREELEKMLEETQSMVGAQSQEVKRARDEIAALRLLINISLGNLHKLRQRRRSWITTEIQRKP